MRIVSAGAVAAGLLALLAPAANADTPVNNPLLGSGGLTRAILVENSDGSGHTITVKGTAACTSSTTNRDYTSTVMPSSWNDAVSMVKDYNQCDVMLFKNDGALSSDTHTGWINGGSSGQSVGPNWNDQASSFVLS
jgi:hypothetical protein